MGKRKRRSSNSDDEDYSEILKQMKRLEKKIKKCRRRIPSSDVMDTADDSRSSSIRSDIRQSIEDLNPLECNVETETELHNNTQVSENEQETVLDAEVLEILGDDPSKENIYGENLHKDITPRWTHILQNGLPKETKTELLNKYRVPENCSVMKAPKLNLEIKAALTELNLKKEVYNENKQNQLSSCLAALGNAINIALNSSGNTSQDILKPLSDAGRLLCDFHYRESQSRRYAIINTLNKHVRDTIKDTKIDEFLFGNNLAEHLKSSKAISKSGTELKSSRPPFKPAPTQPLRGALNMRGASRAAAATNSRVNTAARRAAAAPAASGSRRKESRTHRSDRHRTRRR